MSLGKDLASIRKSQNLSLEDIQNAIKIPLTTLQSIENNSIFSDSGKNKTYVRSFVRSYAKVLKIDDEEIVQALDEVEDGTYSGSLIGESAEEMTEAQFNLDPKDTLPSESPDKDQHSFQEPEPKPESTEPKRTPPAPDEDFINWADMGRKFTTVSKNSRVWLFVLILVIAGSLGTTGYIFWDDLGSFFQNETAETEQPTEEPSDQNAIPPAPVDSTAITENNETETGETPANANEQTTPADPIELDDTLTISVYAAYGQLEPIRVTSDLNWRTNPFWMEQGESYYFDFNDTLLVRGQYSRLLLMFNGHVIENPRQNYFNSAFNSIMITRDMLDQPRYLAPPPNEFPLSVGPPDSTVYRIRF
ncbi:helix-turn-helix domain-containing protein [Gracilimonas sp. BCB1]|uniref:helix-turn-helix domain-containing protein n=1 Tax=Gracilimonas sp. BCB1 TaxID=3152362 RepID=UPI0032D912F8